MGQGSYSLKNRKDCFLDHSIFWGFYYADPLFFPYGMERASMTDYVTGVDQKIPASLRFWFWERMKPLGQLLNRGMVPRTPAQMMPFGARGFSL